LKGLTRPGIKWVLMCLNCGFSKLIWLYRIFLLQTSINSEEIWALVLMGWVKFEENFEVMQCEYNKLMVSSYRILINET
jgi:hypothetical protein